MLAISTSSSTIALREMLSIPRPRTRGECVGGQRPCPWVACRHHLLLEVARPVKHHRGYAANDPGLVLNLPRGPGRRRHLPSSCAAELVRLWIDDALELLWTMPDSCSLDVAERGESRPAELVRLLARSSEGTRVETIRARASAQRSVIEQADQEAWHAS